MQIRCKNMNSQLLEIQDNDTMNKLSYLLDMFSYTPVAMNLMRVDEDKWFWTNDDPGRSDLNQNDVEITNSDIRPYIASLKCTSATGNCVYKPLYSNKKTMRFICQYKRMCLKDDQMSFGRNYSNIFDCYKVFKQEDTWSNARMICQKDGGNLAVFKGLRVQAVRKLVGMTGEWWVGVQKGRWLWTNSALTGLEAKFTAWKASEPNAFYESNKYHANKCAVTHNGFWKAVRCRGYYGLVCMKHVYLPTMIGSELPNTPGPPPSTTVFKLPFTPVPQSTDPPPTPTSYTLGHPKSTTQKPAPVQQAKGPIMAITITVVLFLILSALFVTVLFLFKRHKKNQPSPPPLPVPPPNNTEPQSSNYNINATYSEILPIDKTKENVKAFKVGGRNDKDPMKPPFYRNDHLNKAFKSSARNNIKSFLFDDNVIFNNSVKHNNNRNNIDNNSDIINSNFYSSNHNSVKEEDGYLVPSDNIIIDGVTKNHNPYHEVKPPADEINNSQDIVSSYVETNGPLNYYNLDGKRNIGKHLNKPEQPVKHLFYAQRNIQNIGNKENDKI